MSLTRAWNLKIAIILDDLTASGGGERQALSLARELTSRGHRVTVFASTYDPNACYPDLCAELDIRAVTTIRGAQQKERQSWISAVKRKLQKHYIEPNAVARLVTEQFDILNPHWRPAQRTAVLIKRRWGTPIVWMFNDAASWEMNYYVNRAEPRWVQQLKPLWIRRQERSLVQQIDAVTVLSHGIQALFQREFGIYPHVVRSGLDKGFLCVPGNRMQMRERLKIAPKSTLILVLGLLWPSRRVEDALRAVALLRQANRDVKLVVVGSSNQAPDYLSTLMALARKLDIEDDAIFISQTISEDERRDLYYACDIFLSTNEAQSWGLAPLEAMVCGKPAVVSMGAGVHEVLADGENAIIVPPRRPDLIARAIAGLTDDLELRTSVARKGNEFAMKRFSWPSYASQMLAVFDQALQRREDRKERWQMSNAAQAVPALSPDRHGGAMQLPLTALGLGEYLESCPLCQSSISHVDEGYNRCICKECGYIFENPRPTCEQVAEFYSKPRKYDSWLALERSRTAMWTRRLRKILEHHKPGTLLDIGTGIGQFLSIARPHFTQVYGTEVSESGIRIAKEKYQLDVLSGRVEEVNFGNRKFDNISLVHVLEHVHDPKVTIQCCKRLLKSDGVLIICVPNDILAWRSRLKALGRRAGLEYFAKFSPETGLPRTGEDPEIHLSHFTPPVLAKLLEDCGLRVVATGLDPYFADRGFRQFINHAYYLLHRILFAACKYNAYDTIWMVARL